MKIKRFFLIPLLVAVMYIGFIGAGLVVPPAGVKAPEGGNNENISLPEGNPSKGYYDVIFDSSGGSDVTKQKIAYAGTVTLPEPPEREGYRFDGWMLDGEEWDFTKGVREDMTLTAAWTPIITVGFDPRGGSGEFESQSFPLGECAEMPEEEPEKWGSYFLGWFLDGVRFDFDTPPNGNITLTAEWSETVTLGLAVPSAYFGELSESVTLADGVTYTSGSLRPVWRTLPERLDTVFENKMLDNASLTELIKGADIVTGKIEELTDFALSATDGERLVDFSDYLDSMPSFKRYLEENPIARMSILSNTERGEIFAIPYPTTLSGLKLPFINEEIIRTLLDGEGEFTADSSDTLKRIDIDPYIYLTEDTVIFFSDGEGGKTEIIKRASEGNIIDLLEADLAKSMRNGGLDGVALVNRIREYIDNAYGGFYGYERSGLFIGEYAAWDADLLSAILLAISVNKDTVGECCGITVSSYSELLSLAGMLCGARGLSSDSDYLYINSENGLSDARRETVTYKAIEYMHALAESGFVTVSDSVEGGLLTYGEVLSSYEGYSLVLPPLATWNGIYTRFIEPCEYLSDTGFAVSAVRGEEDYRRILASVRLIDFFYSDEGKRLLSYGTDAFATVGDDGFLLPSDAALADCGLLGGDYYEYLTEYVGALPTPLTHYSYLPDERRAMLSLLLDAMESGTVTVPTLAYGDIADPYYSVMPDMLALREDEREELSGFSELDAAYSGEDNRLIYLLKNGYALGEDAATEIEHFDTILSGEKRLELLSQFFTRLKYYLNNAD